MWMLIRYRYSLVNKNINVIVTYVGWIHLLKEDSFPVFFSSSVGKKNTVGDLAIILLLEILDKMPLTRRMHGILKRSAWKSLWIRVTVSSCEHRSVAEPSVETHSLRLSSWEKSKTFERPWCSETLAELEWPLKPWVMSSSRRRGPAFCASSRGVTDRSGCWHSLRGDPSVQLHYKMYVKEIS